MVEPKYPLLGSCRLVLTIMVFFGVYHLMALRFNLSMALVCMTNDPTEDAENINISHGSITIQDEKTDQCPSEYMENENDTEVKSESEPREFTWSKPFQGALLSSFFNGYILTQVLGGYFSDRFGGKTVFLIGMITLSGTSLLIPMFARISPGLVVGVRVLQGLASGLSFPSLYNLFSSWTDPGERATLMSIAYAGRE
jgi:MFS family permease